MPSRCGARCRGRGACSRCRTPGKPASRERKHREIDLAGDAHTMPQAAQILSKSAGRTITFQPVPIAEVRKASEDYALMLEWFDRVGYDADIPGNAKRYGIKPTTLAEWAARVRWSSPTA